VPGILPDVLGKELEEATLQKDEHPAELLELGETMVFKVREDGAPLMHPAAVESIVSGVVGGVKVSGYVDARETNHRLQERAQALSRGRPRSSSAAYELRNDHAGGKRVLRVRHHDKREDGEPDSKELLYQREGQARRRNDLSDGPGFNP